MSVCLSGWTQGMTITDLEDLLEDIKVYLELEEGKNVDFWRDIIIVTEDELKKLRKLDPSIRGEGWLSGSCSMLI